MAEELTYFQFLNKLKRTSPDPTGEVEAVYHFTGDEDFLKGEALKKLIAILVPQELRNFNLDVLYGAETSADQIINKASTIPVNARKRVVVVNDLDKLSPFSKDMLLSFLPKLPDSVCLILLSPKVAMTTKFYKALSGLAVTVNFRKLWEDRISDWITNRVRERGKQMERDALPIFLESVGTDLATLASEIEKLLIYVGERRSITAADVETVAGTSRSHNVFGLIDSIGEKDPEKSLVILSNLILSGEKPGGIIFWLTAHLERLILTKEFRSGSGKSLASFLKVKPFLASKYQKQAPNFTVEGLEKGLKLLYQTDIDLKSNVMPDGTLLELLVFNLCQL